MEKFIIDVDTGIDDALALIMAIKSKKIDLLGVTTVAGNCPVEVATKNTLRVLKLLEREDIEVYQGASKPIERGITFNNSIHGEGGLAGQLMNIKTKEKNTLHAVDYLIDKINNKHGQLSLVMLGPLTNLALAIKKDKSIVKKIKQLYIMGGAVRVPGNITPVAEFNFYKDPESAYKVLHSGISIKLIGLDVTNQAKITEEDLRGIGGHSQYKEFLVNVLKFYINKSSDNSKERSCIIHDPLLIASIIDNKILEFERTFVDIEYSSRISDGQAIGYFGRNGYVDNVELGVSIDKARFKEIFLDLLLN